MQPGVWTAPNLCSTSVQTAPPCLCPSLALRGPATPPGHRPSPPRVTLRPFSPSPPFPSVLVAAGSRVGRPRRRKVAGTVSARGVRMAGHRAAPSERAPRGRGCLRRESDSTAGRRAGPPQGMNDVPGCAGGQKTRAAGGGERRAAPRGTRVRGGPGRGARG